MKVTVKFSAIPELLSIFKDEKEVEVDFTGDTVKDLLHNLFLKIGPKKGGIFVNDQGEISPWVSVLINGRYIFSSSRLSQKLQENDVVELTLSLG
jgi:sulfur carrier protein ThiS